MWTWVWRTAAFTIASFSLCRGEVVPEALHGDLLDWTGDAKRGELVFRNAENRVFECSFDDRTLFERGAEATTISLADRGARVELLPQFHGSGSCYARSVRFQSTPLRTLKRPEHVYPQMDPIAPRGDLTFAGVVVKVGPRALLLRTRSNERKRILLRPDTRFLGEGQSVECGNLTVNTPVFIRAGRNFEDEVEAYQIVWGEILEPIIETPAEPPTY
jgi:hypothetical protein